MEMILGILIGILIGFLGAVIFGMVLNREDK